MVVYMLFLLTETRTLHLKWMLCYLNNKNIKDDVDEKGNLENTKTVDKEEKTEKTKEREKTKDQDPGYFRRKAQFKQ